MLFLGGLTEKTWPQERKHSGILNGLDNHSQVHGGT